MLLHTVDILRILRQTRPVQTEIIRVCSDQIQNPIAVIIATAQRLSQLVAKLLFRTAFIVEHVIHHIHQLAVIVNLSVILIDFVSWPMALVNPRLSVIIIYEKDTT